MEILHALILGIIQGLTEYLPVSSSGHLEITEKLLGFKEGGDLVFPILVHAATALSSVIVFWKEIKAIFIGLLDFKWNESYDYAFKLGVSAIPVVIIGLFFADAIESLFSQNLLLVGSALLVTGLLLLFTFWAKDQKKEIGWVSAIAMGISQMIAVIPGISRSGATISTALLLGVDREKAARFSFLMVIIPILGKATLDAKDWLFPSEGVPIPEAGYSSAALVVGFFAAFVVGLLACKAMLKIVKTGKIYYFSAYCFIIGLIAIYAHFL